ncbi:transglutaminase domain-containing protein [Methylomarinovum caldicuralii]
MLEIFSQRRGVGQDFAYLAIACLRGLRLTARYVNGFPDPFPFSLLHIRP